jgi:hypothetical protein
LFKNSSDQKKSTIFCRISIENNQNWIHGIITYINLEKGVAEIFLPSRIFKENLLEGSNVTIKSMDQNNEILFLGSIAKKVISIKKQAVTVQIDKVLNFENKRKYERFNVNYDCLLSTSKGEFTGKMIDISLYGCMVYSNEVIEEAANVIVTSFIAPETELVFQTKVLRSKKLRNNTYSYGLQTYKIDNDNNIMLNELIACLIKQREHIEHEWKVFNRLKYSVYSATVLFVFFLVFYIFASVVI